MARTARKTQRMTLAEWQDLPLTFGTAEMARIAGVCKRYVQNNPGRFAGVKVGGKFVFSKIRVAEILGLGLE